MKLSLLRASLLVLSAITLSITSSHTTGRDWEPPARIAFLKTNAVPFKWEENGEFVGPMLDIVREVAKRTGIEMIPVPFPPKRLFHDVESGNILGCIGVTHMPEREEFASYIQVPVGWIATHAFVRDDSKIELRSVEDLYGKRVCVIRGYSSGPEFQDAVNAGKIEPRELKDYETVLNFLMLGRADVAVVPTTVMESHIKKMDLVGKVRKLPKPVRKNVPLHFLLSKNAEHEQKAVLFERVKAALETMQREKVLDTIYEKYGYEYSPDQ